MLIQKTSLIGLIPLLLLSGCLHPPRTGNILCTPQTMACKEFTTVEGVHVQFNGCHAHVYKGHINAAIFCTLSNPTDKDLNLLRKDFRIVPLDGSEMIVEKFVLSAATMPDNYPVKKGASEVYVFSARTKDKRTQKDFKEFMKTGTLAFLHQGSNLAADTLFVMQWR